MSTTTTKVMERPTSEELLSDCESGISGPNSTAAEATKTERRSPVECGELTTVGEEERIHQIIREKLLAGGALSASIEAVRANAFSSMTKKAKLQAFEIFAKAAEKESGCCSGANVRYAWFGASIDDIATVLSQGFLPCMIKKDGIHGHGIYLSPDHFPLESVKSAVGDENGVRHILLCRVILGKTEVVPPGSGQWLPSSGDFHSGVDDSVSPTNYIVWSTNMNTHILPLYLISFRLHSSPGGEERIGGGLGYRKPTSPWIPFTALLSALAKCLPPRTMRLIADMYRDHRERKISRRELIERMREVAGDELLAAIIKAHRTKPHHHHHPYHRRNNISEGQMQLGMLIRSKQESEQPSSSSSSSPFSLHTPY
ncbi:unnamed protein product [Cuscuta campestris]|uniref:Uncharacterized protein n=1 Tax=Cuscuta campestris TaxID=132261 RepID=A0A484LKM3_9ASTE|nr:unnamed protein product [Cuscuta campestris]